ncbi:MAG: FkbM family methyltransferase [Pseudomonadota bacterium]
MKEFLRKFKIARWFAKNTRIGKILVQTDGNWRCIFMFVPWTFVKILVPRKKVLVDGFEISLSRSNWITYTRWLYYKKKEVEVRNYINTYVKDGDVFFDVGANIGVFSLFAGKKYDNISVYSFEPEHSNIGILKENIFYNNLLKKVTPFSVAISDSIGLSKLHIQDFTPGAAVHTESQSDIEITEEGYEVVWAEGIATVTLDYVCEQLDIIPNTIKIDTDGHEDKVLRGAKATLSNQALRSIVIEMPHEDEKTEYCVHLLKQAGFSLVWSDPEKTRNEIWEK